MERFIEREIKLTQTYLKVEMSMIGEDISLILYGGEKPHIGCTVLSIPRESLTGHGIGVTSSVANVLGHKDEVICRKMAEQIAIHANRVVTCTGGFHIDHLDPSMIHEVNHATDWLIEELLQEIKKIK